MVNGQWLMVNVESLRGVHLRRFHHSPFTIPRSRAGGRMPDDKVAPEEAGDEMTGMLNVECSMLNVELRPRIQHSTFNIQHSSISGGRRRAR
jgi:hypothetical protein